MHKNMAVIKEKIAVTRAHFFCTVILWWWWDARGKIPDDGVWRFRKNRPLK